jgi:hypothetical protein
LLAATLYQGNHDRNHKLWNIVSTDRYIHHTQMLLKTSLKVVSMTLEIDMLEQFPNALKIVGS